MRRAAPFLAALLFLGLSLSASAQISPSGLPAATVPLDGVDRVMLDQGTGCPTNIQPCTTKEVTSIRLGQPIQATVAPSSPFQYQSWIDTSLNPPVLKMFVGSTWYPVFSLSSTNGPAIDQNTPVTIAQGGTNTGSQTASGACYFDATKITCPGPLPIAEGGTAATSQTTNGACYYDGAKITCPGALPIAEGGTAATSMTNNAGCYYDNTKVNCTGNLPIASGGTNTNSQTTNGACYFDGTKITCPGPLPVAQGGTADTGTAWTAYTPTVTCASGTLTTVAYKTGQYKAIGKTVFVRMQIGITTNGTCAGALIVSLPTATIEQNAAVNTGALGGFVTLGAILRGECCNSGTQNAYFYKYDGTYPGVDGATIVLQGVYEST